MKIKYIGCALLFSTIVSSASPAHEVPPAFTRKEVIIKIAKIIGYLAEIGATATSYGVLHYLNKELQGNNSPFRNREAHYPDNHYPTFIDVKDDLIAGDVCQGLLDLMSQTPFIVPIAHGVYGIGKELAPLLLKRYIQH
jgi:hypothetical protein